MIVTTVKNPKAKARAEARPDAETPHGAAEDAGDPRADEPVAVATGEADVAADGDPAAGGDDEGEVRCSTANVLRPSAASDPGGGICVAARCPPYSLPHLPFRGFSAGGSGKIIRSGWPANRPNRRPSATRRC